jgi:hypothetical protein
MIVFNATQEKRVTAACITGGCTNTSTYGPLCPTCLESRMPLGSYAIEPEEGKGRGLQTLRPIEEGQTLTDIPYLVDNLELKRQGHHTHVMTVKQLEVLYGKVSKVRQVREQSVVYQMQLATADPAAPVFWRRGQELDPFWPKICKSAVTSSWNMAGWLLAAACMQ